MVEVDGGGAHDLAHLGEAVAEDGDADEETDPHGDDHEENGTEEEAMVTCSEGQWSGIDEPNTEDRNFIEDAQAQHQLAAQPEEVIQYIADRGLSTSAVNSVTTLMNDVRIKFQQWLKSPAARRERCRHWRCRMWECGADNTENWGVCSKCGAMRWGQDALA